MKVKLSKGPKLSPNACLLRKAALSGFPPSPLLAIRARRVWGSSCSMCTGGLQVIARAGNQLQTCSPFGRKLMGPVKALCALAPAPHPLPAREGRSKGPSHKRHKIASGSCFRESETTLGNPSSAPMRVCSGKQRFLVSPLAHCSP